ncbi:hypothetical protein ANN_26806 [Periplaneta americana]|uniref:Uncharacterized protein n=1 Tax=Periplaneta americana TaxID=6978 RepID=A0ABQ8RZC7_PERAM|nr:hypothetical protein ANN_26806 [Periplaneta americana]
MKLNMEKLKNEKERRKFEANFQEKVATLKSTPENSEYWNHLKSCIQTAAEETIGYTESERIKKPWVTGKMLEKMEERRKWKNINTEEDDLTIKDKAAVSEDEKGFSILKEEVELALKEMKNGKATGVDGITIELVKCLGEDKKEILSLCNEIYEQGN